MRRALLLAGIAAGAILLFTASSSAKNSASQAALSQHIAKVKDLAFCQKAYEIASSFPSYAAGKTVVISDRIRLLKRSDELQAKGEILSRRLEGDIKSQAVNLGMDQFTYDRLLADSRAKGELEAVLTFEQTDKPQEVISQLDVVCQQHLN